MICLVDDINDNQPMFTKFHYNASIRENLLVGSPILQVEATDSDSGLNSRLQYQIIGDNGSNFFISPDKGVIYLKNNLDYETEMHYYFTVMVTDYGTPQLTSTAQVWINVLDVNDNAPILPASFTTTIDEDIEMGSFVTKITAQDADWSDRDRLEYKLISDNKMAFSINQTNGIIYVRNLRHYHARKHHYRKHHHLKHFYQNSPYEQKFIQHYELNVSVTDGVYFTTETYFIIIKPANHYSPKFNRILNNVGIDEDRKIGSYIFTANATDQDDSSGGLIEYQLLNEYSKKFFSIDSITGEIYLKTKLDYELGPKYFWLILGALDRGKRIGISTLRVAVIDKNDNIPRFIVDEYECSICLNVPIDSTILSVLALDDDDEPENTIIQYSIYDDQQLILLDSNQTINSNNTLKYTISDYFDISPDTGYIYIRRNLTNLIGKKIQFFVKATNGNAEKLNQQDNGLTNINSVEQKQKLISNIVPVTIKIVDSCQYHKKEAFVYEIFVKENIERGSIVAHLNLDNYKDVELSIAGLDNSMDANKFRIDNNGRIYVEEPLDREAHSKHVLALKLLDKVFLTIDYYYVIINIMDENDCTPYFDSPSYHLTIAENQNVGSTIFKVNALDNDIDLINNKIQYSLADNFHNTFSIDENFGWIVLKKSLDREEIAHYNIEIIITDQRHKNSTNLYITVFDVNDNRPRIEPPRSIAAIYENSYLGTVLLRVKVNFNLDIFK